MAYELLKPYRSLAKDIPATILNSTHRLIITTFLQYHSEAKGVFVSFPTLASELALGKERFYKIYTTWVTVSYGEMVSECHVLTPSVKII